MPCESKTSTNAVASKTLEEDEDMPQKFVTFVVSDDKGDASEVGTTGLDDDDATGVSVDNAAEEVAIFLFSWTGEA